MKETRVWAVVGVVSLLAIIGSFTANLSPFLSGLIVGCGIVLEVLTVYKLAKLMKKND